MDFKAKYPLIAEIVNTFSEGNDLGIDAGKPDEFYFSFLENAEPTIDLDAIEAEARKMDSLEREVIIRGVLPAEANYLDYDEESLSLKYPLVGNLYYIFSDAIESDD
jgi:hypothetical protein